MQDWIIIIIALAIIPKMVYKSWSALLEHNRQMYKMKADTRTGNALQNHPDIKALTQEMRELRERSAQYDLSLQQLLESLQERVERLEGIVAAQQKQNPPPSRSWTTETQDEQVSAQVRGGG